MGSPSKAGGLASAIKDQLALISLLVLFAGFVSTDTYYAAFGLRFQLLDLSIEHLMYRGITALVTSWVLAPAYLIAVIWLAIGPNLIVQVDKSSAVAAQAITYGIVFAATVIAYFGGIMAGREAASEDILQSSSHLPVIQTIKNVQGGVLPFAGDRLLMYGKDQVVVFRAVLGPAEQPFIHILKGDDVGEIVVLR